MAEPRLFINGSLNMRIRNLMYVLFTLTGCVSSIVLAIESPVSSNPLGLGTVPPSAYKSGLIPSISPVSNSGNLIVTGDVAGGKYFRGIVPYRGVTDFGTSTSQISPGIVQVEDFMRYSAGTSPRQTSGLTPYYSPIMSTQRGDKQELRLSRSYRMSRRCITIQHNLADGPCR